ncbi:uncharacterized protein B0I36DRAFT_332424 [Microdochium trichocladiopsis]|uniref:Uncharacterized protein n=1 Tax=Microdochium trichocladiopsis TaxID=1682393 RepID=A0A9P9BM25_9PEZI|nr:uncharacterized protein B0I36DRAFT_332424 [Microdochium trichocladiopsis]KAH7025030.1 hypothetical protein B0I36DRAFT_332424 [Microdochium trichocladiopsis]
MQMASIQYLDTGGCCCCSSLRRGLRRRERASCRFGSTANGWPSMMTVRLAWTHLSRIVSTKPKLSASAPSRFGTPPGREPMRLFHRSKTVFFTLPLIVSTRK